MAVLALLPLWAASSTTQFRLGRGKRGNLATRVKDLVLNMCSGGDLGEHADMLCIRATRRLLGDRYVVATIGRAQRGAMRSSL